MFAVIRTGGKQYKVASGDTLRVERIDAEAGETVQFNEVLVVGDAVGAPLVDGAAVQATVIDNIRGEKLIHFVRRRRKHSSKRTKGHRQSLTLLRVTDILEAGAGATGVKVAVGAAAGRLLAHEAAAPRAVTAIAAAVEPVAEAASGPLGTVAKTARRAATRAGAALGRVEGAAEAAIETVGETVSEAVETVTEAVEDVASSKVGKVGLAMAAAAAVAAVAAAVIIPADEARASDADDADTKE